jgi:ribosome-binding ATPase YchF (GTP1/OBG family)
LRHADALIHVVDVSGTTDAEGLTPVLGRVHAAKEHRLIRRDNRQSDTRV